MDLINLTRFPAHLFRACLGGETMVGSLAARVSYDLDGASLVPAAKQPWLIHAGTWESPYGPMAGDELLCRGGTDLFVFGHCRPAQPARRSEVVVEAGPAFRASVLVFGKRVWLRGRKGFTMSEPEPFTEMPLTLRESFGGSDEWDGLTLKHPANPWGKGYSHTDEHTEGRELPNVEDPQNLIQRWNDQPVPTGVGPAPPAFPARAQGSLHFDPKSGRLVRVDPKVFNAAFPVMVAPFLDPGTLIRVHGVTGGPPIEFCLPAKVPIVRLVFDSVRSRFPCVVDQVGIEVGRRRVFLSYRHAFRYTLVPLQRRLCQLLWPDASQSGSGPGLAEAQEGAQLSSGKQKHLVAA